MAKRVKPVLNIPAVTTLEEADATLAQIAARKRELALLELGLKEDVDALKLKCAEASEPIKQDIEVLEQALIRFGESKKSELFVKSAPGSLRSALLAFGQVPPSRPCGKRHGNRCWALSATRGCPSVSGQSRKWIRKRSASFPRNASPPWGAGLNSPISSFMN